MLDSTLFSWKSVYKKIEEVHAFLKTNYCFIFCRRMHIAIEAARDAYCTVVNQNAHFQSVSALKWNNFCVCLRSLHKS